MTLTSSLLDAQAIRFEPAVHDKADLFVRVARMAQDCYGLDAGEVEDRLTERERLGTTGFGRGVAIPHGKIGGIDMPVGLIVKLGRPMEFQALDEQRVDLIHCLMSPVGGGAAHLKALAEISRLLRDDKILAKLRGARDPDAIFALLTERQDRDAA